MIYFVVAKPRVGKTYFTVHTLVPQIQKKRKRTVVTNIRGYRDADIHIGMNDDFSDSKYDGCLIVLDEVQFFAIRDGAGADKNKFFLHFTVHGHTDRVYIWISQSVAALPTKWVALIEQTYQLSCIMGSQNVRARNYLGYPKNEDMHLSESFFRPRATDKYKSVEDGVEHQTRSMPLKVYGLAALIVVMVVGFVFAVPWMLSHLRSGAAFGGHPHAQVKPSPIATLAKPDKGLPGLTNAQTGAAVPGRTAKHPKPSGLYVFPLSLGKALAYLHSSGSLSGRYGCDSGVYSDDCAGADRARSDFYSVNRAGRRSFVSGPDQQRDF